jgi:hypothetical protein
VPLVALFHRTAAADRILAEGFRDSSGTYLFVGISLIGVFVSDIPVDGNEGAKGSDLLEVRIEESAISDWELVQEGSTYREWCVPSEVLNSLGSIRRLSAAEAEAAESWASVIRFLRAASEP